MLPAAPRRTPWLCYVTWTLRLRSVFVVSQSSPSEAAERPRPCSPPAPAQQQQKQQQEQAGGTPPRSISYNVFI